jgi:aryl-alcohol dehydrogenase-like predicted oxidoreductase
VEYRQLGNTGVFVSRICLGAMTFGGEGSIFEVIGGLRQHDVDAIVANSLDAGVNFIDTANVYAAGESEVMVGKALGTKRRDVVVATKVFGRMGPGANQVGLSRLHIMQEVEASLQRLNTDYIDLYQIHGFDALTPLEETLSAMTDLIRQGKVRYIGCSNLTAWQIMKSLGISALSHFEKFITLQAYYSLVGRELEREIVPLLLDQKMGLLVWSPLASGFLTGKYKRGGEGDESARRSKFAFPPVDVERGYDIVDVLARVGERRKASIAQVAIAWLLQQPVTTSVIIGARNGNQLKDNLGAVDVKLDETDLKEIDDASRLTPEYPGWMFNADDRKPGEKRDWSKLMVKK